LEDDYFDDFEFETEIGHLVLTDTTEFHMASTLRDGEFLEEDATPVFRQADVSF